MAFTQALCPTLQKSLEDVALNNVGSLTRGQTGFLDMLVSPPNKQGFEPVTVRNPNGGMGVIQFAYIQPQSVGNIVTVKPDICLGGAEVAPLAYTIDPLTQMVERWTPALELSDAEVNKLCFASSPEYKAMMIYGQMDALLQAVNRDLLTAQALAFGDFYNSTNAPVNAPLVLNADKSALLQGWTAPVKQQLRKIRYNGRPLVVGQGDYGIEYFTDLVKVGCCNTSGIDVSQAVGQYLFFGDIDADAIWGANHFGVFRPGACQFVSYNKYEGVGKKFVPDVLEHDVIYDPVTGIGLDFKVRYEDCSEKYLMTLGVRFMLFTLPNNMYPAGSPMDGVRNTLRFVATLA